jgi:integrase
MPKVNIKNQLLFLWVEFTAFKVGYLHINTIEKQYSKWKKMIEKMPVYVESERDIFDWLQRNYSAETVRRALQNFNACYDWAKKTMGIKTNPFEKYTGLIKKKSSDRREAFTATDRDTIITAFQERNPYYSPFIEFCFRSGCRNEEARGLEWSHVGARRIRFEQAIASGTRTPAPLKTGESREFPLTPDLHRILNIQKGIHPIWVFPASGGATIASANFLHRQWEPIVKPLAEKRLIDQYLPPSHTRHTFITLALRAGMPIADVATLVGNSPTTILKHYAQPNREIHIPEF